MFVSVDAANALDSLPELSWKCHHRSASKRHSACCRMQAHDEEMRRMAGRMESTEIRQQQMMAFLARAVNNPAFLQQLLSARQTQRSLDNRGASSGQLEFCAPL